MDYENAFWMVWNPDGYPPRVQHFTEHKAVLEAERLARCHPGQRFYVMLATDMRVVDDMKRIKLEAEIPF